jgi:hypothetical protein
MEAALTKQVRDQELSRRIPHRIDSRLEGRRKEEDRGGKENDLETERGR